MLCFFYKFYEYKLKMPINVNYGTAFDFSFFVTAYDEACNKL